MSREVGRILADAFPPVDWEHTDFEPVMWLEWDCGSVDAAIALSDQIEARLEELCANPE